LWYTIQHRTVLIIFPLILQTVIIAHIMVYWRRGVREKAGREGGRGMGGKGKR